MAENISQGNADQDREPLIWDKGIDRKFSPKKASTFIVPPPTGHALVSLLPLGLGAGA